MPLPTIRQLQYLQAISETLNFSAAADQCFVTQSTLSSGIKELENLLGAKVVERTKRKVLLTDIGRDVLIKGEEILHLAQDIEYIAKAQDKPLTGPVRLGIIPTIAPFLLPQLLPELKRRFPHAIFMVQEDLSAHLVTRLQQGKLDFLILALPYEAPGTQNMVIGEDAFVLAEPDLRLPDSQGEGGTLGCHRHQAALTLDCIAEDPRALLLLEDGHCLRDHALAACRLESASEEFRASSLHTLVALVAQNEGITLLPEMALKQQSVANFSHIPNINIVEFTEPKPTRQIGVTWRQSSTRQADYKLLTEFLKSWYIDVFQQTS